MFLWSSRVRHTSCALVTGVQTVLFRSRWPRQAKCGRRLPGAGPALWRTGMVGRHFEIDRKLRQRAMGTQALQAVHARVAGKAGDARPDERGSNTQRMRIDLGPRIVIADCPTRSEERVSGGLGRVGPGRAEPAVEPRPE